MATYSFKIKKGIFQLELSTSDSELLVEQFDKWVKDATIYARKKKANECRELVNSQIQAFLAMVVHKKYLNFYLLRCLFQNFYFVPLILAIR